MIYWLFECVEISRLKVDFTILQVEIQRFKKENLSQKLKADIFEISGYFFPSQMNYKTKQLFRSGC